MQENFGPAQHVLATLTASGSRPLSGFDRSTVAVLLLDPGNELIVDANERAGVMLGYPDFTLHGMSMSAVHRGELQRLTAFADEVRATGAATDGIIQFVNPAFERSTGYAAADVIGKHTSILRSAHQDRAFYDELCSTITRGDTWRGRFVNRTREGGVVIHDSTISPVVDASGVIVNFVDVKRDVTRQLDLEDQLRHKRQIESLGQLAGGVAHDLNNLLTPILGYAELMQHNMSEDDPRQHDVTQIVRAAEGARRLTGQLLAFGRRQHPRSFVRRPAPAQLRSYA